MLTRCGQFVERVAQRQPVVLLIEGLLELGSDRRRHLVGGHAERRLKGMPRADGARQHVQRFRELFLEALQPAGALVPQPAERQHRAEAAGGQARERLRRRTGR